MRLSSRNKEGEKEGRREVRIEGWMEGWTDPSRNVNTYESLVPRLNNHNNLIRIFIDGHYSPRVTINGSILK